MRGHKIDSVMRVFLAVPAMLLWLGIYLTGCSDVHWLVYVPPVFFSFAVLTGICPGMMFSVLIVDFFTKRTKS